jgi:hypothetical protein
LHDRRKKVCKRQRAGPTKQDVSAFILSTILLVSPASSLSAAQPPSLVEPESGAWAVVHAGELWVCWSPGPDCFERVVFDDEQASRDDPFVEEEDASAELVDERSGDPVVVGADGWRLGFGGPRSLWIEHEEQRWRVVDGQRRAQLVEDPAPVRLLRIGPAACGPDAIVPAVIGGRLSFRDAPRCADEVAAASCVTRAGPRMRTPTPMRLRASIEVSSTRGWVAGGELGIEDRRLASGLEVSFVVELGFDWQRRVADRQAASVVARRGRARLRELPTVTPGPLADAELGALAAVVCEGGQP